MSTASHPAPSARFAASRKGDTDTYDQGVEKWRYRQLYRAGFDHETALILASKPSIDLHKAVDLLLALVKAGEPNPQVLAVRILT